MRDNIEVPYRDRATGAPGQVKLIVPFTNPLIVGRFPFHCHISEHSDKVMMGNIVVHSASSRP